MDLSWILPELAVGGKIAPETVEHLAARLGVRRVVDLRAEEEDDVELLRLHGIELLCLPTPDMLPVSQEMLWAGVGWVNAGLDRGEKVLIHCEYGIGRSALLALCVLVSRGYAPSEALALAKDSREKVSPSPKQLHAFLDWSAEWYRRCGRDCPPVTWDELARIAYRHLAGTQGTGGPS